MKTKEYKATLSQKSIKELQKMLQNYKKDIANKCKLFCTNLADEGIRIAQSNLGGSQAFASNIVFTKEIAATTYGCKCLMIMADSSPIVRQWLGIDENHKEIQKTALISPVLMVEFGSGWKADASPEHIEAVNPSNEVGKGTFPSQNNMPNGNINHAKNPTPGLGNRWAWKDLSGVWHTSNGYAPNMPMYRAYNEMLTIINRIAEESFK